MKSWPNVLLGRKGSGTKPPPQERVPSQANGAVPGGRRKGGGVDSSRGVNRNPEAVGGLLGAFAIEHNTLSQCWG